MTDFNKYLYQKKDLELQNIGVLILTTGEIVACDPLTNPEAKPFALKVVKGDYPVYLHIHKPTNKVAFARIQFLDSEPVIWRAALTDKSEQKFADFGKTDPYAIDAGYGCFMDLKTAELLQEVMETLDEKPGSTSYYEDVLADELEKNGGKWADHRPRKLIKSNVVVFESGYGDGSYSSYWGIDKNENIAALVTDFNVVTKSSNSDDYINNLKAHLKAEPTDFVVAKELGLIYHMRGEHDAALKYLTNAIDLNEEADLLFLRGLSYHYKSTPNNKKALADINKAIEMGKNGLDEIIVKSVVLSHLKKYKEAIEMLTALTKQYPKNTNLWLRIGSFYVKAGQIDEAVEHFSRMIDKFPTDYIAYHNRGAVLFDHERYAESVGDFRKAESLNPDYDSSYNLAAAYHELEMYEESLEAVEKGLEADPNNADLHSIKAKTLMDIGEYEEAINEYTFAIENGRGDISNDYLDRGHAYSQMELNDLAVKDYEKAIEINSDKEIVSLAYNNMAYSFIKQEKFDKAVENINKAIDLEPDNSMYHGTRAEIYAKMGDREGFYKHLEIALEKGFELEIYMDDPIYDLYRDEEEFKELLNKYRY